MNSLAANVQDEMRIFSWLSVVTTPTTVTQQWQLKGIIWREIPVFPMYPLSSLWGHRIAVQQRPLELSRWILNSPLTQNDPITLHFMHLQMQWTLHTTLLLSWTLNRCSMTVNKTAGNISCGCPAHKYKCGPPTWLTGDLPLIQVPPSNPSNK